MKSEAIGDSYSYQTWKLTGSLLRIRNHQVRPSFYSLMAVTGNKKLTPVIHCLHLHLDKTDKSAADFNLNMETEHRKKSVVSHSKLLSPGIRKERRRNCPSHPLQLYLMQYSCKFLHVQNKNTDFWKKIKI